MIDEDASIITIICGEDITEDEKAQVEEKVNEKYGDEFEVEIAQGDQPVYSFFVAVE